MIDVSTARAREATEPARRRVIVTLSLLVVATRTRAASLLAGLSQADASSGMKAALERGCGVAVDLLGRADGFWADDRVRIPLPSWLERGEKVLRLVGRGKDIDDLHLGMNRAAEQAVPEAKTLLVGAVRSMSVQDAKSVLTGGDDAATKYFEAKTRAPIGKRFLPIVKKTTERSGLARQYDRMVDRAGSLGVVNPEDAKIEPFVTTKALDGLFLMIAEEEKKIRADPIGTGSAILKKVFGAL